MLILSSPAKRLDFTENWESKIISKATFNKEANQIAKILENQSVQDLSETLKISNKLAKLNFTRLKVWDSNDTKKLKPAILAYQGDVYKALDFPSLYIAEKKYLQKHFIIITGMYGLLKPYDLIQAYRLEMKIKLGKKDINSLYDFWSQKIISKLNQEIADNNHKHCINLASQEYSKVIDKNLLKVPLINIKFTQLKNGVVKSIGVHNKRARGLMLRYLSQNKSNNLFDIEKFDCEGYELVNKNTNELVFLKK
jgi:cytoplasmic iron level regulating protein YaaA (DUF328/UPF0246 family)